MKRTTLWVILAAVILLAYVLFQSRRLSNGLEVEPQAAEEIEKAKRR